MSEAGRLRRIIMSEELGYEPEDTHYCKGCESVTDRLVLAN